MAVSPLENIAKFIGYATAGFGIVFLAIALVVVMLILSLIPIYTPNSSEQGSGEIYTIQGLTLKAVYTNVSYNFTGGSVLSLSGLSSLCTTILQAQRIPGFQACVATNFSAYGPTSNLNPATVVRRRNINDVALYEVGNMQLLFSNTCATKRALGYWSLFLSHRQNSSCLAQRLAACRRFIGTPNIANSGNQWLPFPVGYTQLVIANGTTCAAISITSIYNVAYYNYASVYGAYNITTPTITAGDCQLSSVVPQWYLQYYINSQTTYNGSICISATG